MKLPVYTNEIGKARRREIPTTVRRIIGGAVDEKSAAAFTAVASNIDGRSRLCQGQRPMAPDALAFTFAMRLS
jgi:hypothetical protein